jgi:hypothetical protein
VDGDKLAHACSQCRVIGGRGDGMEESPGDILEGSHAGSRAYAAQRAPLQGKEDPRQV